MRHSRPATAQLGVTLIELMVGLAMLAIMAALAVPAFTEFRERTAVRSVAEQLLTQVANARFEAVKRNRAVRITAVRTADNDWCLGATVVDSTDPCDCSVRDVSDADFCDIGYFPESSSDLRGVRLLDGDLENFDFVVDPALGVRSNLADEHSAEISAPTKDYKLLYSVSPLAHGKICVPDGSPSVPGYRGC